MVTFDCTIVLILVKCRWDSVPLGEVQSGAAYRFRCPKCRLYLEGVAS